MLFFHVYSLRAIKLENSWKVTIIQYSYPAFLCSYVFQLKYYFLYRCYIHISKCVCGNFDRVPLYTCFILSHSVCHIGPKRCDVMTRELHSLFSEFTMTNRINELFNAQNDTHMMLLLIICNSCLSPIIFLKYHVR